MQADTPGYVEVDVLAHTYVFQFWIPGDCSEFDSKIIASHLFSVYVFFFAIHNHKKQCNWNSCYHNQSPCKTGPPSQVHHELISRDSHQNEALTRHVHGNFHCHLQMKHVCIAPGGWYLKFGDVPILTGNWMFTLLTFNQKSLRVWILITFVHAQIHSTRSERFVTRSNAQIMKRINVIINQTYT